MPQFRRLRLSLPAYAGALALLSLLPALWAQTTHVTSQMSPEDSQKVAAVMKIAGKVLQKMNGRVTFPDPRKQSALLPLLPASTVGYAAFANYGDVAHEAMAVFHEQLKDDAELRNWWQGRDMADSAPKIDEGVEKFYQLSQYLGDEIVIAVTMASDQKTPGVIVLAQVRKPGLKAFLQQTVKGLSDNPAKSAHVFDLEELAAEKSAHAADPAVLIRPDFMIAASDLTTLRSMNTAIEQKRNDFASTDFGHHLAVAYEGGASLVLGGDLHAFLDKLPIGKGPGQKAFQQLGFADMKYVVMHTSVQAGQATGEVALSFTGTRHGMASWIASPATLGAFDFASPKTLMTASVRLKNPAQIFDEVKAMSTQSNPKAFDSVARAEQQFGISLRDDLFAKLTGEIGFDIEKLDPSPSSQEWRVLLKTNDPSGLLATMRKLYLAMHMVPAESDEDGVTYHAISIPTAQKPIEIAYAVVDDYFIVGSGKQSVMDAVHVHRSGESLAKSPELMNALPPGSSLTASALTYQDQTAWAAFNLRRIAPSLAESITSSASAEPRHAASAVYADDTSIRVSSQSATVDATAVMIGAAIAIPNLLRARNSADESITVAQLRIMNAAQVVYASKYPTKGYARKLANLGPAPFGAPPSAQYSGLLDMKTGGMACGVGSCVKDGYRFTLVTNCAPEDKCSNYLITATPLSDDKGTRRFCSTADAVIRYSPGAMGVPLASASECKAWSPLH